MQKQLVYSHCPYSADKLAKAICESLAPGGMMETQRFHHADESYTIVFRSRNHSLLRWIALDQNLCISLRQENRNMQIGISSGTWRSKLLIFAVSLMICWPLSFCAAAGMCMQLVLYFHLLRTVRQCMKTVGGALE